MRSASADLIFFVIYPNTGTRNACIGNLRESLKKKMPRSSASGHLLQNGSIFFCKGAQGHFPTMVVGMQQMMAAIAQRLFQVIPVECQNLWVFMGEAELAVLIKSPQDLAAAFCVFLTVVNGLSAAAGASSGAGHDLYEIIAHASRTNGFHQLFRVA